MKDVKGLLGEGERASLLALLGKLSLLLPHRFIRFFTQGKATPAAELPALVCGLVTLWTRGVLLPGSEGAKGLATVKAVVIARG